MDGECIMVRDVRYPLHHRHGKYVFSELFDVSKMWEQRQTRHPLSCEGQRPSDLLFFDTETTGLGGGVGNTIFLIGYSRVLEHEVQIKQFFLPAPSAETAFYTHFLSDIKENQRLVTYNGKAFDWPQVKTRHTLNRDRLPELPAMLHFDLLHASRRLWKDQLPACRLSIIEEQILHFQRKDDTPGHLVPIFYFDFLREQNPDIVEGVLKHNEWDVLSLISLYIHLSRMIMDLDGVSLSLREILHIGRWFESIGEYRAALSFYERLNSDDEREALEAKHRIATIRKKQQCLDEAVRLWEQLYEKDYRSPEIGIELAKAYEHRYKDMEKALYYARDAYLKWKEQQRLTRNGSLKEKEAFRIRIERLQQKAESRLV